MFQEIEQRGRRVPTPARQARAQKDEMYARYGGTVLEGVAVMCSMHASAELRTLVLWRVLPGKERTSEYDHEPSCARADA
eukprot:6179161-Pleurochrysis_carterae.AAC.4